MAENHQNQTEPPNERKRCKRGADQSLALSDDDIDSNTFPHFLVVQSVDNEPIKLSIFAIQKLIQMAVGSIKTAKKLRNGSVLLEVSNKVQADRALAMTNWIDTPVRVTAHRSLNSSKGVIRCREFRDCEDDEVLAALSPQGVSAIKHIKTNKNGNLVPTNTFILTFNTPTPPKHVKAAYLNIPVETFIANPLRCFNCQKFGHGKNTCNRTLVCAKCGKSDHHDGDCREQPHCVNCSGNHPAFSKECPEWIKQREIMQIKAERGMSFGDAKQFYLQQSKQVTTSYHGASAKRSGVSYASVAKSTCSVLTQTDLTWPSYSKVPIHVDMLIASADTSEPSRHTSETQTIADNSSSLGAAGGNRTTHSISYVPRQASTPKTKIQLSSAKPGPASSKPGFCGKPQKGLNDPIKLFNKYGSLDTMDLEMSLSPGKGSGGRKKP